MAERCQMKTIEVNASKSYNVYIGNGIMSEVGERLKTAAAGIEKVAVISDDNVFPIYGEKVIKSLEAAGYKAVSYVFPHGEQSKNTDTYVRLLNFLAAEKLTRTDAVAALGGGVTGDMAGFAAATFLRGIKYIQIPTSLLSMVDSSVGGKTAIDLESGKNLAGAFCQPSLVVCDLDALDTLKPEFFTDGCAEVIKAAILSSRQLFDHLKEKGQQFDREYTIYECIAMKRDCVCEDEFDTGVRRLLNLGHTIGHAIEKNSNFTISHGNAVAIGTALIARIAASHGYCSETCRDEIIEGIRALGLPTENPYSLAEILPVMASDKKRTGASISMIIPEEIGKCFVKKLSMDELEDFIKPAF